MEGIIIVAPKRSERMMRKCVSYCGGWQIRGSPDVSGLSFLRPFHDPASATISPHEQACRKQALDHLFLSYYSTYKDTTNTSQPMSSHEGTEPARPQSIDKQYPRRDHPHSRYYSTPPTQSPHRGIAQVSRSTERDSNDG
jgi:hypothetical protein